MLTHGCQVIARAKVKKAENKQVRLAVVRGAKGPTVTPKTPVTQANSNGPAGKLIVRERIERSVTALERIDFVQLVIAVRMNSSQRELHILCK